MTDGRHPIYQFGVRFTKKPMNFISTMSGSDGNSMMERAAIGKFGMSWHSTGPLSRCKHFRGVLEENASLGFISVSVSEPNERTVLVENYKLLPPSLSEKSLFEMQKVSSFNGFDYAAIVISLGSGRVVATFIVHGTA